MNIVQVVGLAIVLIGVAAYFAPVVIGLLKRRKAKKNEAASGAPIETEVCLHDKNADLFFHFDMLRQEAPPDCQVDLTDMLPRLFRVSKEVEDNE
jgi:hypothetical protein